MTDFERAVLVLLRHIDARLAVIERAFNPPLHTIFPPLIFGT